MNKEQITCPNCRRKMDKHYFETTHSKYICKYAKCPHCGKSTLVGDNL